MLRAYRAESLDGTGSLKVRKPTVFERHKVNMEIREETAFSTVRFLVNPARDALGEAVIMRSGV